MNPVLLPLLLVSLLLAGADGAPSRAELLLGGAHRLDEASGLTIVAEADVLVPQGATVPGPVHVIAGRLRVEGRIRGEVVQLAGEVQVASGGRVDGGVRRAAGVLDVAPEATTTVEQMVPVAGDGGGGGSPVVGALLLAALLGGWTWLLERRLAGPLRIIGEAVTTHPVVTAVAGALLALTAVAMLVFMAFTLVLLPVAALGLVVVIAVGAHGLAGLGAVLSRRLPGPARDHAAVGAALLVLLLQLIGAIPLVGSPLVLAVVLAGLGGAVATFLGFTPLRVDVLPGPARPDVTGRTSP